MLTYQRICQLSCLVSQLLKSSKAVMIRDGWPKMTENCKRRVFEATVVGYLQAGHQVSWSRSFFKASALSSWSHFRGRKAFFPRCLTLHKKWLPGVQFFYLLLNPTSPRAFRKVLGVVLNVARTLIKISQSWLDLTYIYIYHIYIYNIYIYHIYICTYIYIYEQYFLHYYHQTIL
jgi:hypothetical protein